MKSNHLYLLTLALVISLTKTAVQAQQVTTVNPSSVCVTNGEVLMLQNDNLSVESPSSRAVVKLSDSSFAAIEFEYLGPTEKQAPLASGRVVHQLGVKLRSRGCNSIYIMWDADEDSVLRISKQINPNVYMHAQCGVRGYKSIYQSNPGDFPPIRVGETRRLEASLEGRFLLVKIDGVKIWRGDVGVDAAALSGYSGIRTDNVRMKFRWLRREDGSAVAESTEGKMPIPTCRAIKTSSKLRN